MKLEFSQQQKAEFLLFLGIAFLFMYPIIHADFYFRDDFQRALLGYAGWEGHGRPLASIVQIIISASTPKGLLDVAPLTQILSCFSLAFMAFLFNEHFKPIKGQNFWFVSVLLMLNPFYLECFSYRFDAFGMALSLLFVVFAFCKPITNWYGSRASILWLIGSLSLYQTSINLFIALTAIEVVILSDSNNLKEQLNLIFTRVKQFSIAFVLYFFTIGQILTLSSANSRKGLLALDSNLFHNLLDNISQYYEFSSYVFTNTNLFYFTILMLFCCFHYIPRFRNLTPEQKKFSLFAIAIALIIYLVSIAGPFLILQNPVVNPRTIPSIYVLPSLLIALSICSGKKFSTVWLLPIIISIAISYQFGSAMKSQRDFEKQIVTMVHYDLLKENLTEDPLFVLGSFPRAPHSEIAARSQPLVSFLSKPLIHWQAESFFSGQGISNTEFHWSFQFAKIEDELNSTVCESGKLDSVADNPLYAIYKGEEKVFVLLSTNRETYCSGI